MSDDGFTPNEIRALTYVLDEIIPPSADGRLPGAGALGLDEYLAAALRPLPALRAMVGQALAALEVLAIRRDPRGLAALSREDREAALAELAASEHALPPILALHVYGGYYHHPRVMAALGLEPRAPHPHGYAMEPNDLTLLDAVRRRAALYRT